jgi:ABC-type transporter Mla subunit MlaD
MRYVLTDLEQVGDELVRQAAEVSDWLDSAAGAARVDSVDNAVAGAIAEVDLACYQALSSAEQRLRAAARAVRACASDLRDTDADIARQMMKGDGG